MKYLKREFTKSQRNEIWVNYIHSRMNIIFKNLDQLNWDWTQKAPCPWCGHPMLKAQYQEIQPNKNYSWDINHINGDVKNYSLKNLQPMHPKCNEEKSKKY